MKNWGLAFLNYEQANKWLPYGRISHQPPKTPNGPITLNRSTWVPQLWAYVEERALFEKYDFNRSFYEPPNTLCVTLQLPLYFCPSNRWGRFVYDGDPNPPRSRGNYVLNLSNGYFVQKPSGPFPPGISPPGTFPSPGSNPYGPSPFAVAYDYPFFDVRHRPREITDGLSHTMFLSESVQSINDADLDTRGDIFNDELVGSHFMTLNTPIPGPMLRFVTDLYPRNCLAPALTKRPMEPKSTLRPAVNIPVALWWYSAMDRCNSSLTKLVCRYGRPWAP